MNGNLKGRVAVVTGASSGIGEATALSLAEAGAKVALVARRKDRLDNLTAKIRESGGDAVSIIADYSKEADAQRSIHEAAEHFGHVDILVNNAGVMYLEPVADADLGRWRHMMELNVLGLIAATQAALPGMRQRRDGHIVNISSTAGRIANALGAGYSATKFAVVAFSEGLRKEIYKDGIRVTVIEPGLVDTELREHVAHAESQKFIDDWAKTVRQLQSGDIARAVLYAVSQPPHVNVNEILIRPTDQER